MRRIVTWSIRGWHPWAGHRRLARRRRSAGDGTEPAERHHERRVQDAAGSLESKRVEALQQASFPDAQGTPVIVVFSSEATLTEEQKQAIEDGKAWLESGEEPISGARVEYSEDGAGALIFASLWRHARRRELSASR